MATKREITYTKHLRLRLKLRGIPERYPQFIYERPEKRYFDLETGHRIAIKRLPYNKVNRFVLVAYIEQAGKVIIFTCHPITEEQILNREITQRWRKIKQ